MAQAVPASVGAAVVTVRCHACGRAVDVPEEILDRLTAQADVTCGPCYLAAMARQERARAARWARAERPSA